MVEVISSKRWMGWALVASFALNLFFGGIIIARVLTPQETDASRFEFAVAPRMLPQGLPVSVREDLEDGMRAHRHEMKRSLKAVRKKQQEISSLFQAEQLDGEALARAYEEMRELNAELQGPIQEALISAVRGMDGETRRMIINIPEIRLPTELHLQDRIDGTRWQFVRDGEKFEIIIGGEDGDDAKPNMVFVRADVEVTSSDDEKSPDEEDTP